MRSDVCDERSSQSTFEEILEIIDGQLQWQYVFAYFQVCLLAALQHPATHLSTPSRRPLPLHVMPLNYSKWDKLEVGILRSCCASQADIVQLSDDSDIEGHPNVDKRSLIRCAYTLSQTFSAD